MSQQSKRISVFDWQQMHYEEPSSIVGIAAALNAY
jgi:hypothetical protein